MMTPLRQLALAIVVAALTACGSDPIPLSGATPPPIGATTGDQLSPRAVALKKYDGKKMRIRMTEKSGAGPVRVLTSAQMDMRYDATAGRLRVETPAARRLECMGGSIGGGVEYSRTCRSGSQQWDPNADTTFVEDLGQTWSQAASVAASGWSSQSSVAMTGENDTLVAIGMDFPSIEDEEPGVDDDNFAVGYSLKSTGEFAGLVFMRPDSLGVTEEILYSGTTVVGIEITIGDAAGDTVVVSISEEDLPPCGGENNPCVVLAATGPSALSDCGMQISVIAGGALMAARGAFDMYTAFVPWRWAYKIKKLGRVGKALFEAAKGVQGNVNVIKEVVGLFGAAELGAGAAAVYYGLADIKDGC